MKQPELQRVPGIIAEWHRIHKAAEGRNPVSRETREILESLGNYSTDWSQVFVDEAFKPELVRACELDRCTLGAGVVLRNSRIVDTMLANEVVIRDCSLVTGQCVGTGAYIENSRLEHSGSSFFGNDTDISLGNERHLHETALYAELDGAVLCEAGTARTAVTLPEDLVHRTRAYRNAVRSHYAIVGAHARITGAQLIRSSIIDDGVVIEAGGVIEESTLLSSMDVENERGTREAGHETHESEHRTHDGEQGASEGGSPTFVGPGCVLRRALLQPGAQVDTGAKVSRSLLGPQTRVYDGATVTESVVCIRSEIGRGEVTNCLIGPLVNMHHESLLIATLWPQGRGNIGAGAQVGSNHTSRLPDQSLLVGEGVFFGLATAIKFPANYYESPYTVVATGLITGPQRIRFPFSLISILDDVPVDAPSGYNRLIPGWMFSHNLFALLRSERKFAHRLGVGLYETSVVREDTITAVRDALARLEAIDSTSEWYDEGRIDGVGKNVLLEVDRKRAIGAYRDLLEYYALRQIVWDKAVVRDDERREKFLDLIERLKVRARDSRARDFHRGGRVFQDYSEIHPEPNDDEELLAVLSTLDHEEAHLRRSS